MDPLAITPESAADAAAIDLVHASAFPTPAEARLVRLLRAAGRLQVSLVARQEGAVVGHVAFSPVTAVEGVPGTGLAPVAVLPDRQRRGIGTALVARGLESCRALALPYAVVLGDTRYYRRFGFEPASRLGLFDEYGGGEAFQAVALRPGGLDGVRGRVRYAPEFAQLEAPHDEAKAIRATPEAAP